MSQMWQTILFSDKNVIFTQACPTIAFYSKKNCIHPCYS
jgi:hypothetical protein